MIYYGYRHINIPGMSLNEDDSPKTSDSLESFASMLDDENGRKEYEQLLQSDVQEEPNQEENPETDDNRTLAIEQETVEATAAIKSKAETSEEEIGAVC